MTNIQAVSFDVWNTILDAEKMFRAIATEISRRTGLNLSDVEEAIQKVYSRCRYMRRVSEVDGFTIVVESQKMLSQYLAIDHSIVLDSIESAFESIDPKQLIYSDAYEAIELLSRLGIKMGVVGNTVFWSSIYTVNVLKRLGISNRFEVMVFSDEVRVNKPDRRIFLIFSKSIGVEPEKIAHVGDSVAEDVGGALSAGMKAIHIDRKRRRGEKIVLKDLGIALISDLTQVIDVLEEL